MKIMISTLLLVLSLSAIGAEPSPEQIDERIVFVGKLISTSSVAKQVDASGVPGAMELKFQAEKHYEAAIAAREAGDLRAASDALSSAVDSIYAAVDAGRKESASYNRQQRDFDNRLASTEALMSAHKMITEEKAMQEQHRELQIVVARQLAEAELLQSSGRQEMAWNKVNEAYETVRGHVEGLRQGETLVRVLQFDSEEDEFLYELDRNDTHEMLIDLLIRDRPLDKAREEKSRRHRDAAAELRLRAEELAEGGRYREAIDALERSTSELVKAIRNAGVYIPG